MKGLVGGLLGLSLSSTIAAGANEDAVSAGCIGTFLLLALFLQGDANESFVTTFIAPVLLIILFVGVATGGGCNFFLGGSIALFLVTFALYNVPQRGA